MLNKGPADGCRALRPKSHGSVTAIQKFVHFFSDYVSAFTYAGEDPDIFENGGVYQRESETLRYSSKLSRCCLLYTSDAADD